MKASARLGRAWLLMLAGAVLLLDSGVAEVRSRNRTLAAIEALGGFASPLNGS